MLLKYFIHFLKSVGLLNSLLFFVQFLVCTYFGYKCMIVLTAVYLFNICLKPVDDRSGLQTPWALKIQILWDLKLHLQPNRCWKLNPDTLAEQQMVLTAKPSLHMPLFNS